METVQYNFFTGRQILLENLSNERSDVLVMFQFSILCYRVPILLSSVVSWRRRYDAPKQNLFIDIHRAVAISYNLKTAIKNYKLSIELYEWRLYNLDYFL